GWAESIAPDRPMRASRRSRCFPRRRWRRRSPSSAACSARRGRRRAPAPGRTRPTGATARNGWARRGGQPAGRRGAALPGAPTGPPHARIETITLLPAPPLAEAIALERRLLGKARAQARAGAGPHALDWCDRLQRLGATVGAAGGPAWAAVAERTNAAVLVVRIGRLVEALVVTEEDAAPDPVRATSLLERAARARPATLDPAALTRAIERAAPLVRARLGA